MAVRPAWRWAIWVGWTVVAMLAGCVPTVGVAPTCLDGMDVQRCEAAWQLAQPHLRADDGAIEEAAIGLAGGAAECVPFPCPEAMAVTVYFRTGVEHAVVLRVTGGLRVVDSTRIDRRSHLVEPDPPDFPSEVR